MRFHLLLKRERKQNKKEEKVFFRNLSSFYAENFESFHWHTGFLLTCAKVRQMFNRYNLNYIKKISTQILQKQKGAFSALCQTLDCAFALIQLVGKLTLGSPLGLRFCEITTHKFHKAKNKAFLLKFAVLSHFYQITETAYNEGRLLLISYC